MQSDPHNIFQGKVNQFDYIFLGQFRLLFIAIEVVILNQKFPRLMQFVLYRSRSEYGMNFLKKPIL